MKCQSLCFGGKYENFNFQISFIPRHTIVAGYYGFMLVRVSTLRMSVGVFVSG